MWRNNNSFFCLTRTHLFGRIPGTWVTSGRLKNTVYQFIARARCAFVGRVANPDELYLDPDPIFEKKPDPISFQKPDPDPTKHPDPYQQPCFLLIFEVTNYLFKSKVSDISKEIQYIVCHTKNTFLKTNLAPRSFLYLAWALSTLLHRQTNFERAFSHKTAAFTCEKGKYYKLYTFGQLKSSKISQSYF